jgi:hypothetical protein
VVQVLGNRHIVGELKDAAEANMAKPEAALAAIHAAVPACIRLRPDLTFDLPVMCASLKLGHACLELWSLQLQAGIATCVLGNSFCLNRASFWCNMRAWVQVESCICESVARGARVAFVAKSCSS